MKREAEEYVEKKQEEGKEWGTGGGGQEGTTGE